MYIWPTDPVTFTGSEREGVLEAFQAALAAGDSLDAFAEYIPDGVTADAYDYLRPAKPKKTAPAKAKE